MRGHAFMFRTRTTSGWKAALRPVVSPSPRGWAHPARKRSWPALRRRNKRAESLPRKGSPHRSRRESKWRSSHPSATLNRSPILETASSPGRHGLCLEVRDDRRRQPDHGNRAGPVLEAGVCERAAHGAEVKLYLFGSECSYSRRIRCEESERAPGIGYPNAAMLGAESARRFVGARLELARGELANQPKLEATALTSADVLVHGLPTSPCSSRRQA
jgi:hypothetical protein